MSTVFNFTFVPWFRSVAPYIHMHRGKTFVVAFPGELVKAGALPVLAQDLSLLHALGIKVVGMDSDVAPDARSVFVNQVTTQLVGENQVESIGKQIDYKGDIAILSATANATNQNAWIDVMKETLKQDKYKDMKLVKVAYGDDDDISTRRFRELLFGAGHPYATIRNISARLQITKSDLERWKRDHYRANGATLIISGVLGARDASCGRNGTSSPAVIGVLTPAHGQQRAHNPPHPPPERQRQKHHHRIEAHRAPQNRWRNEITLNGG